MFNLKTSANTTAFYKLPFEKDWEPCPYPDQFVDLWHSSDYIKIPFSPLNQVFCHNGKNKKKVSKWLIIEKELQMTKFSNIDQLIKAIKTYNPTMAKMEFNVLRFLINECFNETERKNFFDILLPNMISLTFLLPSILHKCIPILKQKSNHFLFFTQQQVSSLLANAFFCTFPKRSLPQYSLLPEINFKGYTGQKTYC